MHENPRWGGEGIGEAVEYWSHLERCSHDCPHKESLVDPLRMSEVLNHLRYPRMFTEREEFPREGDAHPLPSEYPSAP
ncbi:hypothetical protein Y032_0014g2328 [Ancylostoma ceylanicum]|uniref:Uncharacterized protein n=1 Tax=Ancylostoma ceylanicum TaxID=53326 RepID=A0A016VAT2_9BILA|nr:hypothetical protein Y032_0014g2328 [Ancylostoma ceylanicum]